MEQLPIIIGNRTCGTVRFRREGAYMVCRGQASYEGEMLRLWIYGKGEPGYLGVLIPDSPSIATIRKTFTLSEYSRLPHPLQYCAAEEMKETTSAAAAEESDTVWYAVGDGTLVRTEGKRRIMAFPAEEIRLPRGACFLMRTIEGKEYVIFPC